MLLNGLGLFLLFSGFTVGLGAVTVIDLLGYLGRTSSYWTETTVRTHKVTKPLIWIGISLLTVGELIFFRQALFSGIHLWLFIFSLALMINGVFLSFRVSPFLLQREKKGRSGQILPASWQKKIVISFIISDLGWWGSLLLIVYALVLRTS